jgi:hypothetical protein
MDPQYLNALQMGVSVLDYVRVLLFSDVAFYAVFRRLFFVQKNRKQVHHINAIKFSLTLSQASREVNNYKRARPESAERSDKRKAPNNGALRKLRRGINEGYCSTKARSIT